MSKVIVAASTPMGGAIAIVRISGSGCKSMVEKLCGKTLPQPRRSYYVEADTGTVRDKCVAVWYEDGKSYTGEESAEIYCHGSRVIVEEIIKFFLRQGAVSAERGEFTLRAYQNQRIDLTEAEGIIDLINAETVEQAANAYSSADGELKRTVEGLQSELAKIIAAVEVAIDYPEEDIEAETVSASKLRVAAVLQKIGELEQSFDDGRKIRNGVKVVIAGKPNVGKSSLFNALLGFRRAIVNAAAGTTRDVIECGFVYKGRKFVLADTAGIRAAECEAEKEGIILAEDEIKSADLVIGVGISGDEYQSENEKTLVVSNKCDVSRGKGFNVSAQSGEGIEELKELIYGRTDFEPKGIKINNMRQFSALVEAKECLLRARQSTATADCYASDLSEAYNALGKITGVIGSDEIIAEIFSAFCVGK